MNYSEATYMERILMLIVLLQRSGLAIPTDTNTYVLQRSMKAKPIETKAKTRHVFLADYRRLSTNPNPSEAEKSQGHNNKS